MGRIDAGRTQALLFSPLHEEVKSLMPPALAQQRQRHSRLSL